MEPALMMQTATGLLAFSVVGGLIMAVIRFRGQPHPPTWLAMLRRICPQPQLPCCPTLAFRTLLLFPIAAADDAFLNLNYYLKMLSLPKALILRHAGVAAVGFMLQCAATWTESYARNEHSVTPAGIR